MQQVAWAFAGPRHFLPLRLRACTAANSIKSRDPQAPFAPGGSLCNPPLRLPSPLPLWLGQGRQGAGAHGSVGCISGEERGGV